MEDLPKGDFNDWQDAGGRPIVKILAEDIRETKKLTKEIAELTAETRKMVVEARRSANAAEKTADAAMKRADAAWELVVITRNQITRPWYKKLLGRE